MNHKGPSAARVAARCEFMAGANGGSEKSPSSIVKLIIAAVVVVAAGVFAALQISGGARGLPTGEVAGVRLPPRSVPSSAVPVNPYKEREKPQAPKAEEAPGAGQSWGN